MTVPRIDPAIQVFGTTKLRLMSNGFLRKLKGLIIVKDSHDVPLAVIVPYSTYMAMQEKFFSEQEDERQ